MSITGFRRRKNRKQTSIEFAEEVKQADTDTDTDSDFKFDAPKKRLGRPRQEIVDYEKSN